MEGMKRLNYGRDGTATIQQNKYELQRVKPGSKTMPGQWNASRYYIKMTKTGFYVNSIYSKYI